jgi:hypothetical protein
MSRNVIGGFSLLMALVLTGCAKPPQEAIDTAQAAVENAKTVEAATYASESLAKAEASMQQAQAELTAQGEKMFKSYDRAGELLAQAKADAEQAATDAATGKETARLAAAEAIAGATAALDSAGMALTTAPASKDRKADMEAMTADLETLRGLLNEAQSAYDAGDYKAAQERAQQVSTEAGSMSTDIGMAQQKAA